VPGAKRLRKVEQGSGTAGVSSAIIFGAKYGSSRRRYFTVFNIVHIAA
jgi:hypothetical protein